MRFRASLGTFWSVAGAPYSARQASAEATKSSLGCGDVVDPAWPLVVAAPRWTRTGLFLIAISFLLWAPLPAVPLLPLSVEGRAGVGGGMLLGAEVTFWLGVVLSGPQALHKLRAWSRRWLRGRLPRAGR